MLASRWPRRRAGALAPAVVAAADAGLRQLTMRHGPLYPPCLRRGAAPASASAAHFAGSVLVEDDRDVNLRKHGMDRTFG
jgi:hypothetical protein